MACRRPSQITIRPSSRRAQEIGEALQDSAIYLQAAPTTSSTPPPLVTPPDKIRPAMPNRSRSPPLLRLPFRTREKPTQRNPTAQIEFGPPSPRVGSPTRPHSIRPLPPAALEALQENIRSHRYPGGQYPRGQYPTAASHIEYRRAGERRNSHANDSNPRHGVGDVQSNTKTLSAQRDQRDEDLIFDVRNSLLFDGSLPRGSQIEGDLPGRTLAMNENTEVLNNVSSSLCTA